MDRYEGLLNRIVAVTAELGPVSGGPRYRYGSGVVVAGQTVLTAAHVIDGATRLWVRFPGHGEYEAAADAAFVGSSRPWRPEDISVPDMALVEIGHPVDGAPAVAQFPPLALGRVDREAPAGVIERVRAIGFPSFAEVPVEGVIGEVRDTVEAAGTVQLGSSLVRGMLDFQVSVAPRDLPAQQQSLGESAWSGMSGAPVLVSGRLIGVVAEHAPRAGPSSIMVTPLTALEENPNYRSWGAGVGNAESWWDRLGATGLGDLVALPARREASYRATLREFGAALHARMPYLKGREDEFLRLSRFACGSESYLWWTGLTYAGKSALLYEAVTTGVLPDKVDVVSYFLSRRRSDASEAGFLNAVVPQLEILCDEDHQTPSRYRFDEMWQKAAAKAQQDDRHLLLVVDALDEDLRPEGMSSVAETLPRITNDHAHVVVSSRPYPELQKELDPYHPLACVGQERIEPFPGSAELAADARREIEQLANRNSDASVEVLGLLTAARGPLSSSDLSALLAFPEKPTFQHRRDVQRLLEHTGRSLEQVGHPDRPRYQFAHATLIEYAQKTVALTDPDFRARIHDWAGKWREDGWPDPSEDGSGTPLYLLDTYPATLDSESEQVRLSALTHDIGWLDTTIRIVGVDFLWGILRSAVSKQDSWARILLAAMSAQAKNLRALSRVADRTYVLRQLCWQALFYGATVQADAIRRRILSVHGAALAPIWTSSTSHQPAEELGVHLEGPVMTVAVLSKGRVISGGSEGWVRVWELDQPGVPLELGAHDAALGSVAVLSDGQVVSGSFDGRIRVWDLHRPGVPLELGSHGGDPGSPTLAGAVVAVAELSDGKVVSGGLDGRVRVWNLKHPGVPIELGTHERFASSIAVLSDRRVVSGGSDGRVRVWDLSQRGVPIELGTHDGTVRAIAVLSDRRVVSGGSDGRVRVWDLNRPGAPLELGTHEGLVWSVAVLSDGRVVSGGSDGQVKVWDPNGPGVPLKLGTHDGAAIGSVAVLPDNRVVSGGMDGRVRVWEPDRVNPVAEPSSRPVVSMIRSLAALPDGRLISGGHDGQVCLWNIESHANPHELGSHGSSVLGLTALSDERVVSAGNEGQLWVWDVNKPGSRLDLGLHKYINAMAVLPNRHVVSTGHDDQILVWDTDRPGVPLELGTHKWVKAVAALPDGRVISASESDGWIRVWNVGRPRVPLELGINHGPFTAVAVLSDEQFLSVGLDGQLWVWNINRPQVPLKLGSHGSQVKSVAVLPDGRVVSAGNNDKLKFWSPARPGKPLNEITLTTYTLSSIPARKSLVTNGQGIITVWDILESKPETH